jgi:hypothetical protein
VIDCGNSDGVSETAKSTCSRTPFTEEAARPRWLDDPDRLSDASSDDERVVVIEVVIEPKGA